MTTSGRCLQEPLAGAHMKATTPDVRWCMVLVVWLLLMATETLHGTLRALFLAPVVGDFASRQIGVLTGSVLVLALAVLGLPWTRARHHRALILIGVIWATLTLLFEITVGRLIVGASWARLLEDYDLRIGGLMPLGLLIVMFAPLVAARWRHNDDGRTAPPIEPRHG
jgi:hypothetical protein